MPYKNECFVVMPFGRKPTGAQRKILFWRKDALADFDLIYQQVFQPAIQQVQLPEGGKLVPYRADATFTSGIISQEMFERIEYARMVLADITGLNANVFLELGHRYRARETGTVVVRQLASAIPFD